jgi:hypothetical protein
VTQLDRLDCSGKRHGSAARLMRFLGLANYFAEFVENFAKRTKHLYEVLSGCAMHKRKAKQLPVYVPEFEKRWGQDLREAWLDLKLS